MSSKTERRALAVWLLLGTLGCPDSEPLLLPPPPLSVSPAIASDAGAPAAAVAVAPIRVQTLDAVVFEFGGKAEVRRGGAGDWVELAVGDAVRVSDEVRTSADGHLEMRFGAARIQVQEGSGLTLKFLEARAIRAEVRGVVSGNAPDGGELTFEGNGVVAVAKGQLSLDANDQRSVVSSTSGGARLTAGGSTIDVPSGESVTAKGANLSRSTPVPKRVLLKVDWPKRGETNQPFVLVKGRAGTLARVLVMGRRVEPAADGTFETRVELKRGAQSVSVLAIDPLGRRATDQKKITFDPNAPAVSGKVEYR